MAISKGKHTKRRLLSGLLVLAIIFVYVLLSLALPVKALIAPNNNTPLNITTPPSNLPWPSFGEAAVGLGNGTIIQTHGNQKPDPTASVAKLITALSVLKKYPLSLGQSGPLITITPADYAIYTKYIAEQGSVVPVYSGEQLTEYQMLEAMLVPSGNNIADSLAIWAYGSLSNYRSFATNYVKQLGLTNTHIGVDASGYSPTTTSTASDLIKIGSYIMANPVLAQIVDMKAVNVPNVGVMSNYDTSILGTNGIVGIKTGNSNQAGGVFLGAAKTTVNNKPVTILVAIMEASTLTQALNSTVPLVISIQNDFAQTIIVNKGEVLGEFRQPWGGIVQVAAKNNLEVYLLQGEKAKAQLHLSPLKINSPQGSLIGYVSTKANQFNSAKTDPLVTLEATTKPSWQWKLLHPTYIF